MMCKVFHSCACGLLVDKLESSAPRSTKYVLRSRHISLLQLDFVYLVNLWTEQSLSSSKPVFPGGMH